MQFFKPMIGLFILVTMLVLIFSNWLDKNKIDHSVLLYANLILIILTAVTGFLHIKAIRNNNPYSFVRSITLSAFIKLIIIAAAVLIYFLSSAGDKSIFAIAASMILYIVYTILEVKGAMRLNRNRNGES